MKFHQYSVRFLFLLCYTKEWGYVKLYLILGIRYKSLHSIRQQMMQLARGTMSRKQDEILISPDSIVITFFMFNVLNMFDFMPMFREKCVTLHPECTMNTM